MSPFRTRVAGTGSYLPPDVITNFDLEKLVDTNDQWIRERTGIERRHKAAPGIYTSDLAYEASVRAIKDAGLQNSDINMIIVCTVTGDQPTPSTACMLQSKLGIDAVPGFDLSAACSGFVYGLQMADNLIRNGVYKNVLVVGAEVITRFINYKDRETCILFGDGAGAWVLSQTSPDAKDIILSSHLRADGQLNELFVLPAGGSKIPLSTTALEQDQQYMRMKGREIFKNAVRTMSHTCAQALEYNNVKAEEVDWLVPHQANQRILEAVADHFDFPRERVVSIVHEMGNTSAATVPVAFDFARQDGRIKRGQTILLTAFGAGLTSGSLLMRF